MDRDQAKEYAKGQLENYLRARGINTRKNFKCLVCHGGDKTPPMAYKDNKVHCFSCNFDGDIFDLIKEIKGITDTKEIFEETYKELGITVSDNFKDKPNENNKSHTLPLRENENPLKAKIEPQNYKEYIFECNKRVTDTDYFIKRGLSAATINKFKLGYDPKIRAAIIPVSIYYYISRSIEGKQYFNLKNTPSQLLNIHYLKKYNNRPIFITEGSMDALSIEEAGGQAIGLNGTGNANKLVKQLENMKEKPIIIIALDNDEPGEKAAISLSKDLDKIGVFYLKANVSGEHKDPNEALINDNVTFKAVVQEIENQAIRESKAEHEEIKQEYLKQSAAYYINDFVKDIADSVNTPAISTGFSNLDELLDGGLYEGLYIIGAISSLGKTTFILQIADQIAQRSHDILIFSLEMARTELMAKSISRLTLLNTENVNNAKTTRGITEGKRRINYSQEEKNLINKSILSYGEYAKNIYINEGLGTIGVMEIRKRVEDHLRITGKTPIVIIDYLQILSPMDPRASDKQNTDTAVLELKRISRDYKTPVIGISSLNRNNYTTEINMAAFKESGAIEYSSDVLIGLQYEGQGKDFDIEEAANQNPRAIELKILKQRNGKRGKTGFHYYPLFNYFKEIRNSSNQRPRGGNIR